MKPYDFPRFPLRNPTHVPKIAKPLALCKLLCYPSISNRTHVPALRSETHDASPSPSRICHHPGRCRTDGGFAVSGGSGLGGVAQTYTEDRMKIPGTVWTAGLTLIVFAASYFFGADAVGGFAALAVTASFELLKVWRSLQLGDVTGGVTGGVSTRGTGEQPSALRQWLLG